jgi:hypothetical protein
MFSLSSCSSTSCKRFGGKEPLPCLQPGAFLFICTVSRSHHDLFSPCLPLPRLSSVTHPSGPFLPATPSLSQGPLRDPFRFSFPAQTLRFAPAVARARPPGFGSFRFAPSKKSLARFANPGQPSETSHLLRLWKVKPPLVRLDSNSISKGPNQNAQPH